MFLRIPPIEWLTLKESGTTIRYHIYESSSTSMNTRADTSVKSARRILEIFEFFFARQMPANLAAISQALNLPRSSTFALIKTLVSMGYIYLVNEDLGYYPTDRWLVQAQGIAAHTPVASTLASVLRDLQQASGETVVVAKREQDMSLFLTVLESTHEIRFSAHPGSKRPLHGGASGLAMMAAMPTAEREALLARLTLTAYVPSTITDLGRLRKEIEAGVRRGWQVSIGEIQGGSCTVAVGFVVGSSEYALVIGSPVDRGRPRIKHFGKLLKDAVSSAPVQQLCSKGPALWAAA